MKQDTSRIWEPLFRHALDILDSASANAGGAVPDWSVGGGTMLMRRYRHRESRDVDIFIGDPQWIGVLTPRLNTFAEGKTSEYVEQAGFLKLYFADGEVDFIVAGNVTDQPFAMETVLGRSVRVETDAEIIGKKVSYRAAQFRARDIFDLACVLEKNPAALGAIDGILAAAKPVILARLDEREPVLREDFQAIEVPEDSLYGYYASAWAWVHFLQNRYADQFERFWYDLGSGIDPHGAWAHAFGGLNRDRLHRELLHYLDGGRYAAMIYRLERQPTRHRERILAPAEVHLVRARMAAVGPSNISPEERAAAVEEELRVAVALDPENLDTANWWRLAREPDPARRVALARKLTEIYPNKPEAWRALATATHAAGGEDLVPVLKKAVQIVGEDAELLVLLAREHTRERRLDEALVAIERAERAAPRDPEVLELYATVLAALGRCSDAVPVQKRALGALPETTTSARQNRIQN